MFPAEFDDLDHAESPKTATRFSLNNSLSVYLTKRLHVINKNIDNITAIDQQMNHKLAQSKHIQKTPARIHLSIIC